MTTNPTRTKTSPKTSAITRSHPVHTDSIPSPMAPYFRTINETPLLTAAQEQELAHRIQEGDGEARDLMVRANLRLVVNLARRYRGQGLDLPDLIAEGNLGLLRAVEGFNPFLQTRFSTYAVFWIRQSIRRALVNAAKTIRLPAHMVHLVSQWLRASNRLHDELGRPPTPEEVARALNLSPRKLGVVQRALRLQVAHPDEDSDHGEPMERTLIDRRAKTPDAAMVEAEDLRALLDRLDSLEEREAAVLRLRFGLGGEDPCTLAEIGERLGLTRERVRQLQSKGLRELGRPEGARHNGCQAALPQGV